MSKEGNNSSNPSVLSTELFLDKLSSLEAVTSKKMFGGHGVFQNGKMFGLVNTKGEIFLKADDSSKVDYLARGSVKHEKMPYFTIPDEILNDVEELIIWSKKAIALTK